MALSSKYSPNEVEDKWYKYWLENNLFASKPDQRTPYTIVIPPPNVTGILHMGHLLNNTVQDILIRKARMQGYNACWVPGMDHASIATEAKVVDKLKREGIDKNDLSRDQFVEKAWEWTDEYGGIILEQLKKLGCSCDWDRTKFTLDDSLSESVIQVFIDLFNKGLIYKGNRMINWDPVAQTNVSDEEVIHKEEQGTLYYINYSIEGEEDTVTIATTRPETIFGDTALCIHPEDERYLKYKGKKAIVPIVGRTIPIIEDTYVDRELGSGCLKVTPAHDTNDYALGQKHNLQFIDIFNPDATLNSHGLHYEGVDRFKARKQFVKELEEQGFVVKKENHFHKVGTSERTHAVIEPRISKQWFLKMEEMVKPALKAVLEDKTIDIVPSKFEVTYKNWLENIRDWNISRQLWWGHRIPVFYLKEDIEKFVVAPNIEKAVELAKEKYKLELSASDLKQEDDVLDTWFSSWLWPISVFDGIRHPKNEEFNYYYPTNVLVTGPDILFFWVSRMIFAGFEFKKEKPFSTVYFTGLVRDDQGRKMSKQLGNSPDALNLIKEYGADSVRLGLMLSVSAGNDLLFKENLCQQGKNFGNKIWNAFRLVNGWETNSEESTELEKQLINWYDSKFNKALKEINEHFKLYRLKDALMVLYKLIWDDYCSWFLEGVKPGYEESISKETRTAIETIFNRNLRLLHPFMPFITEELWQHSHNTSISISEWPKEESFDNDRLKEFEFATEVISSVRKLKKDNGISQNEKVELLLNSPDSIAFSALIKKLAHVSEISEAQSDENDSMKSFRVNKVEFYVPLEIEIDIEKERSKLTEELNYTQGFLKSIQKKLSNERFVSNAPEKVVLIEKKKESDALQKIEMLTKSLENLGS